MMGNSNKAVEKEINTVGGLKKWLEVLRDDQVIICDIQLLQDKDDPQSQLYQEEAMNDIDKWAAARCGVTVRDHTNYLTIMPYSEVRVEGCSFWTIEDPRCREIVQEHFKINTVWIEENKWRATENKWRSEESCCIAKEGGCPAEAEISCIQAIYEASQ